MSRSVILIFGVFLCVSYIIEVCRGETSFAQDSYANALQNSHQTDFGDSSGGGYDYAPPPTNNNYLPPDPKPVYGQPVPTYGPPPPVYGPPSPLNFYAPIPSHSYHPRDHWFLEKLKTKINLFTIGKIILKLLIFKKIIKFIGVICLLLFLPKLKNMFKDDVNMDDDNHESKQEIDQDYLEDKIEEIYDKFMRSMTKFDEKAKAI